MYNFYNNYFKPQNVSPNSMLFSAEHIVLSILSIISIIYVFSLLMKHCNIDYSKQILKNTSILMVLLEAFRISWLTFYYGFSLKNIRFDWCNQICLMLPYITLMEKEKLYPYIDLLAFIGGVGVIIYPLWVFYDYAGIHIMSVQSMVSHTLMVIISISMSFTSNHWENNHSTKKPFTGFLFIAIIAYIMSRVLNVNYLIMLKADGVPILSYFAFPWYWIIMVPVVSFGIKCVKLLFQRLRIKINQRQEEINLDSNNELGIKGQEIF